jgi:hypothetical protein
VLPRNYYWKKAKHSWEEMHRLMQLKKAAVEKGQGKIVFAAIDLCS